MAARTEVHFDGFMRAEGADLVDGLGRAVLLRGVGLGNWLLPEGYMWGFPSDGPQSPREIEAFVSDLVGPEAADTFWRGFRDAFITEADIVAIAGAGFDHVRLPLNARALMDEAGDLRPQGLRPVDRLIEWCRRHRLWVILDLHGAPGGQTGTNIDDSPRGLPDLFVVAGEYRARTIALWTQLAERYRDDPVVAGYDLLNEPLPHEYGDRYAASLVGLYRDLTAAIREVDQNHLLIYEGTRWSTDWSIFSEVWDPNSMLQFHKYWSAPDRPSIAAYLAKRAELSLPIYMGEGGENGLAWIQTAFALFEDLGISWNFWPWKKLSTWTSPSSVVAPEGWGDLVEFAVGRGARPSDARCQRLLDDLLAHVRFDRCVPRPHVSGALFHRVPVRLAAESFGFEGPDVSYQAGRAQPLPWFRGDDGVTLRARAGDRADAPFEHVDSPALPDGEFEVVMEDGDWVEYSIDVPEPARLSVEARLEPESARPSRQPRLELDGVVLLHQSSQPGRWVTDASIAPGRHRLRVVARGATALGWLQIDACDPMPLDPDPPS